LRHFTRKLALTKPRLERSQIMANDTLKGLNVAILVTDGFEQVELTEPRKALDEAGATTKIVSPKHPRVRAWNFTNWSIELPVDVDLDQAKPEDFDALLLPGGVINRTRFALSQMRYLSRRRSSMPENRLQRSAMVPGP
jgi:putative intracellular protease/amidase